MFGERGCSTIFFCFSSVCRTILGGGGGGGGRNDEIVVVVIVVG